MITTSGTYWIITPRYGADRLPLQQFARWSTVKRLRNGKEKVLYRTERYATEVEARGMYDQLSPVEQECLVLCEAFDLNMDS